jgi:hypothetical protein
MPILEAGVENLYWTTKCIKASEMIVAEKEGTCVELLGGKVSVRTRQMVPQLSCMFQSERPQFQIGLFGPMEQHMKEHSACRRGYCLNRAFGYSILMVGTNASELQFLAFVVTVGLECLCSKDAIFHMISLDRNTAIESEMLIFLLANDSLAITGRDLIVDENMPGDMIDKDRTAGQFVALLLFAICVRQVARDGRDILIEGDTVTRIEIVMNQRINFLGVWDGTISIGPLGRGFG